VVDGICFFVSATLSVLVYKIYSGISQHFRKSILILFITDLSNLSLMSIKLLSEQLIPFFSVY